MILSPVEMLYIQAGVATLEANEQLNNVQFKTKNFVASHLNLSKRQVDDLVDILLKDLGVSLLIQEGYNKIQGEPFLFGTGTTKEECVIDFLLANWFYRKQDWILNQEIRQKVKKCLMTNN